MKAASSRSRNIESRKLASGARYGHVAKLASEPWPEERVSGWYYVPRWLPAGCAGMAYLVDANLPGNKTLTTSQRGREERSQDHDPVGSARRLEWVGVAAPAGGVVMVVGLACMYNVLGSLAGYLWKMIVPLYSTTQTWTRLLLGEGGEWTGGWSLVAGYFCFCFFFSGRLSHRHGA